MARNCKACGEKISILSTTALCKKCNAKLISELNDLKKEIISERNINVKQLGKLKKFEKKSIRKIFKPVIYEFIKKREIGNSELNVILKIVKTFDITKEEIDYGQTWQFITNNVRKDIVSSVDFNNDHIDKMKLVSPYYRRQLLGSVIEDFASQKELGESELDVLSEIQKRLKLSNTDINFNEKVKPHIYVHLIRDESTLPEARVVDISLQIVMLT